MKRYFKYILMPVVATVMFSCAGDDDKSLFYTDESQTIIRYISETADGDYDAFVSLLDRAGYQSVFGAYGNYTVFAFSNAAWEDYLALKDKTSIADFTEAEAKELAGYHIIASGRVYSESFKSGNLDKVNLTGDNLVSSFGAGNQVFINGHEVIVRDLELLNGVLYMLDGVIDPVKYTIAEAIDSTGGYSLFREALVRTGFMELLGKTTDAQGFATNYTVLMNPDELYSAHGIDNFAALLGYWGASVSDDLQDTSSTFYQYVARHIIKGTIFQNRFETQLYKTLGRLFLDVSVDKKFIINPDAGDGTTSIELTGGNVHGKNGVYHVLTGMLDLSAVKLKTLYFDFTDQAELLEWKSLNAGNWTGSEKEQYAIEGTYARIRTNCTQFFYYHSVGGGRYADLHDQNAMLCKQGGWYVDFDVSELPEGKYELWVHVLKANASAGVVQCYWDGLKIGRIFGMGEDAQGRYIGGLAIDRWGVLGGNFRFKQVIAGKYAVLAMYLGDINAGSGEHVFGMKTVIDGLAMLDRLEFVPLETEE